MGSTPMGGIARAASRLSARAKPRIPPPTPSLPLHAFHQERAEGVRGVAARSECSVPAASMDRRPHSRTGRVGEGRVGDAVGALCRRSDGRALNRRLLFRAESMLLGFDAVAHVDDGYRVACASIPSIVRKCLL